MSLPFSYVNWVSAYNTILTSSLGHVSEVRIPVSNRITEKHVKLLSHEEAKNTQGNAVMHDGSESGVAQSDYLLSLSKEELIEWLYAKDAAKLSNLEPAMGESAENIDKENLDAEPSSGQSAEETDVETTDYMEITLEKLVEQRLVKLVANTKTSSEETNNKKIVSSQLETDGGVESKMTNLFSVDSLKLLSSLSLSNQYLFMDINQLSKANYKTDVQNGSSNDLPFFSEGSTIELLPVSNSYGGGTVGGYVSTIGTIPNSILSSSGSSATGGISGGNSKSGDITEYSSNFDHADDAITNIDDAIEDSTGINAGTQGVNESGLGPLAEGGDNGEPPVSSTVTSGPATGSTGGTTGGTTGGVRNGAGGTPKFPPADGATDTLGSNFYDDILRQASNEDLLQTILFNGSGEDGFVMGNDFPNGGELHYPPQPANPESVGEESLADFI